jgi:hypothetical protein
VRFDRLPTLRFSGSLAHNVCEVPLRVRQSAGAAGRRGRPGGSRQSGCLGGIFTAAENARMVDVCERDLRTQRCDASDLRRKPLRIGCLRRLRPRRASMVMQYAAGHESSVDDEDTAGDVAGVVGAQIGRCACDVLGPAVPLHRHVRRPGIAHRD